MDKARELLLAVARLFWLACGISLWLFWLVSIPAFMQRAESGTLPTEVIDGLSVTQVATAGAASWGISVAAWSWVNTAVHGLVLLTSSLIALLIWWRVRSGFGLLTAFVLLLGGSAYMNPVIYGAGLSPTAVIAWELGGLIWPLFIFWLYIFPNGRPEPRLFLWILAPLLALFSLPFVLTSLIAFLRHDQWLSAAVSATEPLAFGLILLLFPLVVGAQVVRYVKVSGPVERLQTRWFLFGLIIFFLPTALWLGIADYPGELGALAFMALPAGIGISILRYRLWDIDLIIRKTLIYSSLSALLALVYFGMVVLLQTAFDAASDQQSPIAIVISTLLIAALFSPLRRRIQNVIDHRFFRKKYDARQVLAQFARTARDEVSLEVLTAALTDVVQETIQPERVSLWLRDSTNLGRERY